MPQRGAVLVAMAGLPASGKSTIAAETARMLGCSVLSVDPIEAAMWTAGVDRGQPTGLAAYVVAEAVAREQLSLGHDVIVDAVNDAEAARRQWRDLAAEIAVPLVFVEVSCPDEAEHRRRLESRRRGIPGFTELTWDAVTARRSGFTAWEENRLRLDSTEPPYANARVVVAETTRLRQVLPDRRP